MYEVDDETLARRIKHRDEAAMNEMVSRHYACLYRFLFGLSRRAEDAEDLAQQTFIRALTGIERYDGRAPMRHWVLGIAYREFCKWRRRRLWLPLLSDRPSPGDAYADLIDAHALLEALSRLSNDARSVFLLHHVEELSIPDIAVALGLPEGTVKSRLFHARQRLRTLLGEEAAYVTEPV